MAASEDSVLVKKGTILKNHMQIHETGTLEDRQQHAFQCDNCGTTFKIKNNLETYECRIHEGWTNNRSNVNPE